jgi:hypothetical protein
VELENIIGTGNVTVPLRLYSEIQFLGGSEKFLFCRGILRTGILLRRRRGRFYPKAKDGISRGKEVFLLRLFERRSERK